jgi:hypothetical protein
MKIQVQITIQSDEGQAEVVHEVACLVSHGLTVKDRASRSIHPFDGGVASALAPGLSMHHPAGAWRGGSGPGQGVDQGYGPCEHNPRHWLGADQIERAAIKQDEPGCPAGAPFVILLVFPAASANRFGQDPRGTGCAHGRRGLGPQGSRGARAIGGRRHAAILTPPPWLVNGTKDPFAF